MKTMKNLRSWLSIVLTLLLALPTTTEASAQSQPIEGGEAFYIWQNDGHFAGFFYDQVKQISYSRLDTLGVEHDDYVSQEIVTADSTYRFMLTAIDSVGFVQPEIKFSPKAKFMRAEGMMPYYQSISLAGETFTLIFKSTMPTQLQPKVGDVLVCPDLPDYQEPFAGKVSKISNSGGNISVECGYIDQLGDLFQQFITIEQLVTTDKSEVSRRRIAGLGAPNRAEGNWDNLTLMQLSRDFEDNLTLMGSLKLQISQHIGIGVGTSMLYKITATEFYVKSEMTEEFEVGAKISLDGSIEFKVPFGGDLAKLSRVPFPSVCPIFYLDIVPKLFARGEAHLNVGLSTGLKVMRLHQSFEVMDRSPYININFDFLPSIASEGSFDISAEINGYVQTGVWFPFELGTHELLKNLVGVTVSEDIYAGPKVSGAFTFAGLETDFSNAYDYFKDAKVDLSLLSIDNEFSIKTKGFWGRERERKLTKSFSASTFQMKTFPAISDMKTEISGMKMNTVSASFSTSGDVFLPQRIGFALYAKDKPDDPQDKNYTKIAKSVYRPETYFLNSFNGVDLTIDDVAPGVYMARPVIKMTGKDEPIAVYSQEQLITIAPKDLIITPETIQAEEDGGDFSIELFGSLEAPLSCETQDSWIHPEIVPHSSGSMSDIMTVKVDANDTDRFRTGKVTVRMRLSTLETVEKELTVKQYGGLELSPTNLEFETDGGTLDVDVLTSMSPINIDLNGNDDWLAYDLEDRKLHLTAKTNNGSNRTGTVIVSAWSSKHQGINTAKLTVNQKGLVNVTLNPTEISFVATGGSKQVDIMTDGAYALSSVSITDKDKEWLLVEQKDRYFIVTALPNTFGMQRQSEVYCTFTKTNSSALGPVTFETSVKVTQESSQVTISADQLHFTAEGGEQQVKINAGLSPYCGAIVDAAGLGWVHASVATDGTVTIKVDANPSGVERQCYVECYVSGKANPTAEEMVKLPVKITQAAATIEPIVPDGDKSPFNYINFVSNVYVNMSSTTGENYDSENPTLMGPSFSFTPKNSSFKVTEQNGITHIECRGQSSYSQSGPNGTNVTLSFDIDSKTKTAKNVKVVFNADTKMNVGMPTPDGYSSVNILTEAYTTMALAELPLQTYSGTYKSGKSNVGQGLSFTDFSSYANITGTYSDTSIPAQNYKMFYEYTNDSRNSFELTISAKEGSVAMEWPSDEVLQDLRNAGMPVYEGSTPPAVSGTYKLEPISIVADKTGASEEIGNVSGLVIKFSGQQGDKLDVDFYFTAGSVADYAIGTEKALIRGNGSDFSICIPESDGAFIISGQKSGNSITGLHFATTATDQTNQYFIMKDADGSSSTATWAPMPDDD